MPDTEEMEPWFLALLDLWENREKWAEAAHKEAGNYDLGTNTRKLIDCIEGMMQNRMSVNPFVLRSGMCK